MRRVPTSSRLRPLAPRAFALFLLPLAAWACDDGMGAETAYVSLALTDAEGDVAAVWVEIGEIYLQGGGNQGRVTLLSESDADLLGPVELTSLAGTTLDLVEDVAVPPGNYGQLRFVLEGAVLETEEGEVYSMGLDHPTIETTPGPLVCPSCEPSGVKVTLPGAVADLEAGAHLIVLHFDVAQSFGRMAGGSGAWVMHPVISGAELGFTGAVTGTVEVEPPLEIPDCPAGSSRDLTAFVPQAVAATLEDEFGDPLTLTAAVAADGSFAFPFLTPDDYTMGFVSEIGFDGSTLTFGATAPGLVTVTSGGALELAYTITSAVCTP
jgi:hypothetical protein